MLFYRSTLVLIINVIFIMALFSCKSLILTATVGLSFFVKTKQDDDKSDQPVNETSIAVQQDEDNQIIMLLKHAKLFEMKQEFDRAEDYYHRALNMVTFNQQQRTWSSERVLQARVYIYDGMANLALVRGQLKTAEKLFKEVYQI
jgi:tetratricopeptide (TPR) repeat protein